MYDQKSYLNLTRKNGSVRNLALFITSGHNKKGDINITFEFQVLPLSLRNKQFGGNIFSDLKSGKFEEYC